MASNNYIYKMSNAGGMSTITRYTDMLAGNTTWNPWSPAGAYESIATFNGSGGGNASFTSIPQTYKHLQLRVLLRSNNASNDIGIFYRLNGDTGNNYSWHRVNGDGASATATNGTSSSFGVLGRVAAGNAGANIFGVAVVDLLDYTSTTKNKTLRSLAGNDRNGSGDVSLYSSLYYGSTNAITQIDIGVDSGNPVTYSQIALYGIRG
jgi:hypothetical protein